MKLNENIDNAAKIAYALCSIHGEEQMGKYKLNNRKIDVDVAKFIDIYGMNDTLFGLAAAMRTGGMDNQEISDTLSMFIKAAFSKAGKSQEEATKIIGDVFTKPYYEEHRFDGDTRIQPSGEKQTSKRDIHYDLPKSIDKNASAAPKQVSRPPMRRGKIADTQPTVVDGGTQGAAMSLDAKLNNVLDLLSVGSSIDEAAKYADMKKASNVKLTCGLTALYVKQYIDIKDPDTGKIAPTILNGAFAYSRDLTKKLKYNLCIKFGLGNDRDLGIVGVFTYSKDSDVILVIGVRSDYYCSNRAEQCILTTKEQANKDLGGLILESVTKPMDSTQISDLKNFIDLNKSLKDSYEKIHDKITAIEVGNNEQAKKILGDASGKQ